MGWDVVCVPMSIRLRCTSLSFSAFLAILLTLRAVAGTEPTMYPWFFPMVDELSRSFLATFHPKYTTFRFSFETFWHTRLYISDIRVHNHILVLPYYTYVVSS
ncbi:hypothetical protein B0H34DRAFT_547324 [Crassisporium funariophilum]|nr:hypothetical protein B0H34DRAFT_547324 [Crassisporium funariophilum]